MIGPPTGNEIEEQVFIKEVWGIIEKKYWPHLTEREQLILILRFGLRGQAPHTYKEIAEKIKRSVERTRQIERRALLRLRRIPFSQFYLPIKKPSPTPNESGPPQHSCLLNDPPSIISKQWLRPILFQNLRELGLPERIYRRLTQWNGMGGETIADLVTKTPDELLQIDYIGWKSVVEISKTLAKANLFLGMDTKWFAFKPHTVG